MNPQNKNLIYAIYHNCAEKLYSKPDNVKLFISVFNKEFEVNKLFIYELIKLLSSLGTNIKILVDPEFSYTNLKYKDICSDIDTVIINENKNTAQKKLDDKLLNDYLGILLLLISTTGNIKDVDTFLSTYEFDQDVSKDTINIAEFINEYNKLDKTILDILLFIDKYKFYEIINCTDAHEELTILSIIHGILTDPKLINVVEYKNRIFNLCTPFIDVNTSDILKFITSGIYNKIIDITQYNFTDNSKQLIENGVIPDNIKDIFTYVGKSINFDGSINTLSDIGISLSKDSNVDAFINAILNMTPAAIYDSENKHKIDIKALLSLLTELVTQLLTLFGKISNYNNLGNVIANRYEDTTVKDILILFSKNAASLKTLTQVDKQEISDFSHDVMKNLFGNNISTVYKDAKYNDNILEAISQIYTSNGKLDVTELSKIFHDYIYALTLIFGNFAGSGLDTLYTATLAIINLRTSVPVNAAVDTNILMFGARVLFEETGESKTEKSATFAAALTTIADELEKTDKPLLTVCKDIISDNVINTKKSENVLKLITDIIAASLSNIDKNVKGDAGKASKVVNQMVFNIGSGSVQMSADDTTTNNNLTQTNQNITNTHNTQQTLNV